MATCKPPLKASYTVPCGRMFRDRVLDLAARRGVNVGDLARSMVLALPADVLAALPDSGEPTRNDRETVVLKSGPAAGRPWQRKPRLQVRMAPGLDPATIRRALGAALALDAGDLRLEVNPPAQPTPEPPPPADDSLNETLEELRAIVSILMFETLPDGVQTRDEALFVLGLPPGRPVPQNVVRARYRMLATIHHPDGAHGDHERMSQLNAAAEILRRR